MITLELNMIMAIKDSDSIVVVIGGKKTTIAEVKKSYANLAFLSKTSAMNVVSVLHNSTEPLTREQIAKQAGISVGYTIEVLNNLIKFDYVANFHIGKRKLIYYALTEKGYSALVGRLDKIPTS
jgi:DNA-binding transcriptional regulator GbsR (MarR family)